jgi:diguanylate cyclase (GGDEF)-like protein
MPGWGLASLGPLGVALVAYALAATPGADDGALLYALPVLWTTLFFGSPRRDRDYRVRWGRACRYLAAAAGHQLISGSLGRCDGFGLLDPLVVLALERRNQRLMTRLADEARTDALTGLLNRRGFDERASVELARARRCGGEIAVATFDIDHFKHINDEWGHETGDRVLAHVGHLLNTTCREIDVAARLGEDEFTVLLPGSDNAAAAAFTQRIRGALAAGAADPPTVCISAGVVTSNTPVTIEQLLQRADPALYEAKRSRRDRTTAAPTISPAHALQRR